jgi:hypothetical protein
MMLMKMSMRLGREDRLHGKLSTIITLALMVPAMFGYLYYGWLLYQTITSETNLWTKTLFAALFICWLLPLIGLLFFAIVFWREKDKGKGC